jgi:hypothetical protein
MSTLDTVLILISGFLIGSFIPFSRAYLAVYIRRHRLGWKTVLALLLPLLLVPVIWVAILDIAGLMLPFEEADQLPGNAGALPGMAAGFGFLAGVAVFIAGLVSAIRSRRRHLENPSPVTPSPGR